MYNNLHHVHLKNSHHTIIHTVYSVHIDVSHAVRVRLKLTTFEFFQAAIFPSFFKIHQTSYYEKLEEEEDNI